MNFNFRYEMVQEKLATCRSNIYSDNLLEDLLDISAF